MASPFNGGSVIQGRFSHGAVRPHPHHAQRRRNIGAKERSPHVLQPHGGFATQAPEGFLRAAKPGVPLPDEMRDKMEKFYKTSFSDVRIHVGPEAGMIGAQAFTLGSRLFFAPGQYNPQSLTGRVLIGHELAHVVQQKSGRLRAYGGRGLTIVHDPRLEAEADTLGHGAARAFDSWPRQCPTPIKPMATQAPGAQTAQPMLSRMLGFFRPRAAATVEIALAPIIHEKWETRQTPIERAPIDRMGELGHFNPNTNRILIDQRLPPAHQFTVLEHEKNHVVTASAARWDNSDREEIEQFEHLLIDELTANIKEIKITNIMDQYKVELADDQLKLLELWREDSAKYVERIVDRYIAQYAPRFPNVGRSARTGLK